MPLLPLEPHEARAALRGVVTVVTADGPMHDTQRHAMTLGQRLILHTDEDIDTLAPIAPEALAAAIPDPALRRQVLEVACAYALLGDGIRPPHLAALRRFAAALDVEEPAIDHLRLVMEERTAWLVFDFRRRSAMGDAFKDAWHDAGLRGVFDLVRQLAHVGTDPALAARFHALEALPPGTLGRELWEMYHRNGFAFPGDRNGTPLPLLPHDLGHVLSGYGTDVIGEIRELAFQAGFKREKPLMFVFLLLYQVQVGIPMTGFVDPGTTRRLFDDPATLEAFFAAYVRGSRMTVDLMDGKWDYWSVLDRPVEELRAIYGISD